MGRDHLGRGHFAEGLGDTCRFIGSEHRLRCGWEALAWIKCYGSFRSAAPQASSSSDSPPEMAVLAPRNINFQREKKIKRCVYMRFKSGGVPGCCVANLMLVSGGRRLGNSALARDRRGVAQETPRAVATTRAPGSGESGDEEVDI